jgi:hypothetical protein
MLHHIKILCNHQEDVYEYFIKWIAQMIQYPHIKSICPTFISKEGAGKGTFLKLMKKMLGSSKIFETTDPAAYVWGNFNGQRKDAFFVILNEISKKDTIDSVGKMKALITDDMMMINEKHIKPYKSKSCHRFMITTNSEEPITTKNDDRRNLIIRSSDEKCLDIDYFKNLNDFLDDNVIKKCYEYFKNSEDMEHFSKLKIPEIKYQNELKLLSQSPIETWLKDYVIKRRSESLFIHVLSSVLFDDFVKYKIDNHINFEMASNFFGVRLNRFNFDGLTRKHTNKRNLWSFDIKKLERVLKLNDLENLGDYGF